MDPNTRTIHNLHTHLPLLLTALLLLLFTRAEGASLKDYNLSLDQKIGQLFIVPACPLRDGEHRQDLQFLIEQYHIGGILIKQGTALSQLVLIEQVQQLPALPLICVQDGEWGVAMRLIDAIAFPKNLTLGAIQNPMLLRQLGKEIGRQCQLVGSHLNLAPVVDINLNPNNPIIHMRSFGEDPEEVAHRALLIMQGIESMGVITCAKHFPGHGDTSIDSHIDLPLVPHNAERLQAVELYPFQQLIQAEIGAVMSAHLSVPAFCETPSMPVTFSYQMITGMLQERLGFSGIVITDALNMKALSSHYQVEEIAVRALLAGHDLLLYGDHIDPNIDQILREDIPRAFHAIKEAVARGEITEEMLDHRVGKILRAKQRLGLFHEQKSPTSTSVIEEINSKEAFLLKRGLFQEAVTVVRNEGIIPLAAPKVVLIEWGEAPWFRAMLHTHGIRESYALESLEWVPHVDADTVVVLSLASLKNYLPEFGLGPKIQEQLQFLAQQAPHVVGVLFGTPYSLAKVPLFEGLILAYENEREAQETVAEILFGWLTPKGRLPVSILPHFPRGTGLQWVVE